MEKFKEEIDVFILLMDKANKFANGLIGHYGYEGAALLLEQVGKKPPGLDDADYELLRSNADFRFLVRDFIGRLAENDPLRDMVNLVHRADQ